MRQTRIAVGLWTLGCAALLAGCAAPAPEPTPKNDQPAPKAITAEERAQWYRDCWGLFNDKKFAEFKNCYAADATSRQLGYGLPSARGPEQIVDASENFAKGMPDARGEAQIILVNGAKIAGVYLLKGANTGPLKGPDGKEMPPTNKKFGLLFAHVIETDPAALKVVKEIGVQESGTFAAQIGLSKNPVRPVMETAALSPVIAIAKNGDAEMRNVEVYNAQTTAWNKHDAPAVDATTADDAIIHNMTAPKDENKKESSKTNMDFWKAFSDAHLTIESPWGAGPYVVAVGVFDGTNDGAFPAMGIQAKTGKKVTVPFVEIDRLEGGKIKETWLFYDGGMFADQLGLKPPAVGAAGSRP